VPNDVSELLTTVLPNAVALNISVPAIFNTFDDNKKREYILVLSEHMYKDVFVLDKEINAFACWYALSKI